MLAAQSALRTFVLLVCGGLVWLAVGVAVIRANRPSGGGPRARSRHGTRRFDSHDRDRPPG